MTLAVIDGNTIEFTGITWTFDKNLSADGAGDTYHAGHYADGTAWVVGPVNVTGISPESKAAELGDICEVTDQQFPLPNRQITGAWVITQNFSCTRIKIYVDNNEQPASPAYYQIQGTDNSDVNFTSHEWYYISRGTDEGGDYLVFEERNLALLGLFISGGSIGGCLINGSMLNPAPGAAHGYTSLAPSYSHSLNVGMDIDSENPLTITTGSLVSTTSRIAIMAGAGAQMNATWVNRAAILTVVSEAPAEGSFRPPYCGTDKSSSLTEAMLSVEGQGYDLLQSLAYASKPDISTQADRFARPWIDHGLGWQGRQIHPHNNMPNYGLQMHNQIGDAALCLHLDYTNEQKRNLLVGFVQLGIDLYGIIEAGGTYLWANDGGHSQGRKWPILFAGLVLNDADMKAIGEKSGAYLYSAKDGGGNYGPRDLPPDYIHFGEDDQTFYVTQADVDWTNSPSFNPDSRDAQKIPYQVEDIGLPEWGVSHATDMRSNHYWYAFYRDTSEAYVATKLAALMMTEFDGSGNAISGGKVLWNHNAIFDYVDRRIQSVSGSNFARNIYTNYRSGFGLLWTADLSIYVSLLAKSENSITLTANVSGGTSPYSYQWYKWDGYEFQLMVGKTSATLEDTELSSNTEYTYKVTVADSTDPADSVDDTLSATTNASVVPSRYALTVTSLNGTVNCDVAAGEDGLYEADTVLTLTAVESRYTLFTGWSGVASGKRKHIQITMNSAKNITANFVAADVNRVNISGLNLITKTPIEV